MLNPNSLLDRQQLTSMIRADIDAFSTTFDDGHRRHLGASEIGNSCNRYLWYKFRWMFHFSAEPRMYRLWQRGHREEVWFIQMLLWAGWTVIDRDPDTGKQLRVNAVEGHFGGSMDAIGLPPARYNWPYWMLLEFKTNKTGDKWNKLEAQQFQRAKPLHWSQTAVYGLLKGLYHVAYFNVNKDDDRLHIEVQPIDMEQGRKELQKAEFVILSQTAPQKLHQNPAMYECKYCDALQVCHKGAAVLVNCRSCTYAQPAHNRQWYCNGYKQYLSDETIKIGCANHRPLVQ